ncbi:MAG: DUF6798 domain-containing protein, partial [Gemmataceae bacterium]
PWRLSALLVPLSTLVILLPLARRLAHPWLAGVLFMVGVGGAGLVTTFQLGYQEPASEDPVLQYVRRHAKPGELYLIPAKFPAASNARGVYSNTFAPAPKPDFVAFFELQRFRLATGAPLFIDFKSIPYRDDEVLEWHRRISQCERWFANPDWSRPDVESEIRTAGITHVVSAKPLTAAWLVEVFRGGAYTLYEVEGSR